MELLGRQIKGGEGIRRDGLDKCDGAYVSHEASVSASPGASPATRTCQSIRC